MFAPHACAPPDDMVLLTSTFSHSVCCVKLCCGKLYGLHCMFLTPFKSERILRLTNIVLYKLDMPIVCG